MRAVVYRGVNDLRLETVPVPRIGPGELLVRVAACGVCPTDIKKIQYGTVPPPRIFGHETAGMISKLGSGVAVWELQDWRPCGPAPSRAVPRLPYLPASRLRPMRDLQTHRHHRRIRARRRRLRRIRPRPALCPARRRENSRPEFLCRRRPARTRQHRPQSRPPIVPLAWRRRARGRAGACRPHVHPPAPARRHAGHRHRFDGRQTQTGQKIRRQLGHARSKRRRWAELPLRHSNPGRAEHRRPALPLSAPKRGVGGRRPGEVFSTFIHRTTCGRGLDAAVIAVPSDAVVRQAQTWLRGGGQLMSLPTPNAGFGHGN